MIDIQANPRQAHDRRLDPLRPGRDQMREVAVIGVRHPDAACANADAIGWALVHPAGPGMVGCSSLSGSARPMPQKHDADRRHHIPKTSFKVRNWPACEADLRRRGSLTLWIEDAALECWQTLGPSGQARYTGAAIQTSLMLRAAFKPPLRQIEGPMTSGTVIDGPDDFQRRITPLTNRCHHRITAESMGSSPLC
jgi:hypothetical protein